MAEGSEPGRRIVLGVGDDGVETVDAALRALAFEARGETPSVVLVHGLGELDYPDLHAPERRARATQALEATGDRLTELLGRPVPWRPVLSGLSGVEAVVTESAAADLVVVQRRDRGRWKRLTSGSVTSAVAAQSRCPVLVVRADHAADRRDRIVVGVDEELHALEAVAVAFAEADRCGAELTALHAWGTDAEGPVPYGFLPEGLAEQEGYRVRADAVVAAATAAARAAHPKVAFETSVLPGRAAEALEEASRQHDLVVVARHSVHHLASLGLGHVARHLLTRSACPVLVTPAYRDERPAAARA